jgi:hypothetical protein
MPSCTTDLSHLGRILLRHGDLFDTSVSPLKECTIAGERIARLVVCAVPRHFLTNEPNQQSLARLNDKSDRQGASAGAVSRKEGNFKDPAGTRYKWSAAINQA